MAVAIAYIDLKKIQSVGEGKERTVRYSTRECQTSVHITKCNLGKITKKGVTTGGKTKDAKAAIDRRELNRSYKYYNSLNLVVKRVPLFMNTQNSSSLRGLGIQKYMYYVISGGIVI